MASTVPFQYLMHLLTVPVRVGEKETRFIVDTGSGVNLISDSLARALGVEPSGSVFTGRRMSGQAVTAPMTSQLAGYARESRRGPERRWCDASSASVSPATRTREAVSTMR